MSEASARPEADEAQGEGTEDDRIEQMVADTLLGDLVGFIVDEIRAAPDVWDKLSQESQDQVLHRAQLRSTTLINRAVNLIAAQGRDVISADLEQITAKDEIKAVCKLGRHDSKRHALLDAVGKRVLLVVAESEPFMGGDMPKSRPDQQELPIADAGEGPGADPEHDPTTVH